MLGLQRDLSVFPTHFLGKAEIRCVVYLFLYVNIVFLAGKFYGKKVEKDFFFPHTRDKGVCG